MDKQTILEGYSNLEKGAYLAAIASLATADSSASEDELVYLRELGDAAQLSADQKQIIESAATELSGDELKRCLDVLKDSDLKYSLITDLIAFAKLDNHYSEEEQKNIQHISEYLGVNQQQFSLLDQFSQKATEPREQEQQNNAQNFFGMGGLKDKMQNAGINTGGLLKGLVSIAAPVLIGSLMNRGMGRRSGGGMFGGLGGMGGGLGSIIGMLSGGRGFGSTGGLLGKILGGRF